jgi:adenine-specific DNA-methyltransferase
MLFADDYFKYKFPEPQYLGAKFVLLDWIKKFIPKDCKVGLDAFAGTQSVAFLMKQLGFRVITNDFLQFNHQIGLAFIENKKEKLTKEDLEILLTINEFLNGNFSLMRQTFTDVFFTEEQSFFLDNFRANVNLLENPYKRALALATMNRSITRKILMGHFAHSQALVYANTPERVKRNPSIAKPVKELFLDLLPKYNEAIFDNGQENKSFGENILDLLPKLLKTEKIDFVYFDPPYCDSHADYQSFYHLTETFTEYWKDKQFINSIKRYEPQRFSGFDKKRDIIESLHKLFDSAKEIPHWLISYNNRSYPQTEEFLSIIKKYKRVEIETKTYLNGRGGKGSVAGSQEILFVCKDREVFNVKFSKTMTNQPFSYWKKLYESDKLEGFNFNPEGLLWLKIKSILRKELIANFLKTEQIGLKETSLTNQFIELYDLMSASVEVSHNQIDSFIRLKNIEQVKGLDIEKLVSELYKLREFNWGGDYKNALDKFLVDRYIKVYQDFGILFSKFEGEISRAVQGYVLCSWYNHWSSILIEHIFKTHPIVLPTVGQIKKVDFFINNIPFDLKVTYLPANFIETKRRGLGLKPELTELKQKAKEANINFTKHKKSDDIYYEIVEKMKDRNDDFCRESLQSIKDIRLEILNQVIQNPRELIQNLYEQQGELRFDASNRLFLILVDTEDFDNSWKLKRNLDLLTPNIKKYLDDFAQKKIEELKVTFNYKGKDQTFTALSDAIFILK